MSTAITPAPPSPRRNEAGFTPDDLQMLPESAGIELVDGRYVEKGMGFHAGRIGSNLSRLVGNFIAETRAGWQVDREVGFQCFPFTPGRIRKPELAFISLAKLAPEDEPRGYCPVVPDLVAEVVSPNDLYRDVADRIGDYRRAGVPLIWLVDPDAETVTVFRPNEPPVELVMGDQLTGDPVLPGLTIPVATVFARVV